VTAGLTQSAADLLAAALDDWDNGRSGPAAAGAVIDAARALLVEHEQARDVHAAQLAQVAIETGRVLAERGEEIAGLTAERDRLRELATQQLADLYDRMAAELDQATAERGRLAGQVQRVRDLCDGRFVMVPVGVVLAELDGGEAARAAADDAAWDDAVEATAQDGGEQS
jgi:hypothetical protein